MKKDTVILREKQKMRSLYHKEAPSDEGAVE